MNYIYGKKSELSILFPKFLDQIISSDNEVPIIDLFVESINLADFKFVVKTAVVGCILRSEVYHSFQYNDRVNLNRQSEKRTLTEKKYDR